MSFVILVVLASSLLPATAFFLLTSYRRWIALTLCALPPLAAWMLPELHHAALVALSGMVAVTATLLLVLFDLCSPPAERASFLRGGVALTLVSSIPGLCAATVAFDFNPRREFCAGACRGRPLLARLSGACPVRLAILGSCLHNSFLADRGARAHPGALETLEDRSPARSRLSDNPPPPDPCRPGASVGRGALSRASRAPLT